MPKKEAAAIKSELGKPGAALQRQRTKLVWNQEEFAEAMNVNSIKYFEQGGRIPSLPMLMRIAKALKLKLTFEEL